MRPAAQAEASQETKIEEKPKVNKTPAPVDIPAPDVNKTPEPVVNVAGCEKYRSIIDDYAWNVDVAIAVCNAESSGNTNTSNMNDYHSFAKCRGSFGLFQINCSHGRVYNPAENIRIAAAMWEASGWKPWAATTCKYKVKCY